MLEAIDKHFMKKMDIKFTNINGEDVYLYDVCYFINADYYNPLTSCYFFDLDPDFCPFGSILISKKITYRLYDFSLFDRIPDEVVINGKTFFKVYTMGENVYDLVEL